MGSVTYYVVVPFDVDEEGNYFALEPMEARSAGAAHYRVQSLASAGKGGVAFSRTGDPALGEFSDRFVLAATGHLPDHYEDYLSG